MPPVIDPEACVCCGTCENKCPMDVIYMTPEKMEVRYPDECWHCGACRQDCLAEAITIDFSPTMLNV